MKTTIIYHSSTGNTRVCVEAAAAEFRRLGHDCALIDVRHAAEEHALENLRDGDLIGVATPTYAFQPALNLMDFVKSLPPLENKPGFILCTYGGAQSNTMRILANALQQKNIFTIAARKVKCEESFTPIRFRFLKWGRGRPREKDLEKVRAFIRRVCDKARGPLSLRKRRYFNWPTPFYLIALMSSRKNQLKGMFGKRVIVDRCASCGVCAKICPTRSIQLAPVPVGEVRSSRHLVVEDDARLEEKIGEGGVLNLPRFADTCMACYGCVNLCPEDAIYTPLCRNHPRYRGPAPQ